MGDREQIEEIQADISEYMFEAQDFNDYSYEVLNTSINLPVTQEILTENLSQYNPEDTNENFPISQQIPSQAGGDTTEIQPGPSNEGQNSNRQLGDETINLNMASVSTKNAAIMTTLVQMGTQAVIDAKVKEEVRIQSLKVILSERRATLEEKLRKKAHLSERKQELIEYSLNEDQRLKQLHEGMKVSEDCLKMLMERGIEMWNTMDQLNKSYDEVAARNASLITSQLALKEELAKQLDQLKRNEIDLKNVIEGQNNDHKNLEMRERENECLLAELNQIINQNEDLEKEASGLSLRMKELKEIYEDEEHKYADMKETVDELNVDEVEEERRKKNDAYAQELNLLQEQKAAQQAEIIKLKEQIEQSTEAINERSRKVEEMIANQLKIEGFMENCKQEEENLMKLLAEEHVRILQTTEEISTEKEKLQLDCQRAQEDLAELRAVNRLDEENLEKARRDIQETLEELNKVKAECQKYSVENENLKRQLEEEMERRRKQNEEYVEYQNRYNDIQVSFNEALARCKQSQEEFKMKIVETRSKYEGAKEERKEKVSIIRDQMSALKIELEKKKEEYERRFKEEIEGIRRAIAESKSYVWVQRKECEASRMKVVERKEALRRMNEKAAGQKESSQGKRKASQEERKPVKKRSTQTRLVGENLSQENEEDGRIIRLSGRLSQQSEGGGKPERSQQLGEMGKNSCRIGRQSEELGWQSEEAGEQYEDIGQQGEVVVEQNKSSAKKEEDLEVHSEFEVASQRSCTSTKTEYSKMFFERSEVTANSEGRATISILKSPKAPKATTPKKVSFRSKLYDSDSSNSAEVTSLTRMTSDQLFDALLRDSVPSHSPPEKDEN